MGRRPSFFDMKQGFMENVEINPDNGCWIWKLKSFRYRVKIKPESIVLNPRRYCAYIHGYGIPVGRNVINGCANPKCVNPEHTILKHNRKPLNQHTPQFLDFKDLINGSLPTREYYGKNMEEIRALRRDTLELIRSIRMEPMRMRVEHIVNKYDIGPSFAERARNITAQEFKELLKDPSDNGDVPLDEQGDDLPRDAAQFRAFKI